MAKKKVKAKAKAKTAARRGAKRALRAKAKSVRKVAASRSKARPVKKKVAAKKAPAPQPARSKALAAGYPWITPALTVRNMKSAIDFYTQAFGFKVRASMAGPDGNLVHAELNYHESVVMLGPENQQMGSFAPQGPTPVTLYVYVENVDATVQRAAGLGGRIMMPVADMFWGDRCGVVVDPEGHSWMIATHVKDVTPEEMKRAMQSSMPAGPPPPIM